MYDCRKFYIGGKWVSPARPREADIGNPATEASIGRVSHGSTADVDAAVAAAREAFQSFSRTSREERIALLERIHEAYLGRFDDIAWAICREVGAPISLSRGLQAQTGILHLETTKAVLANYEFLIRQGESCILKEPIGVCGLITPWNWPINQLCVKLIPAIAAGNTVVLKPSEETPVSAMILAEVMHAANVPPGVFNLVNGTGPEVGAAIAGHRGIDMVSFTGSTAAGIKVAHAAAPSVKRVTQELGGKSPSIILADADLQQAVDACIEWILLNSGQSCSAPSRLLVPRDLVPEVERLASTAMAKAVAGDPEAETTTLGPVINKSQWDKIQRFIQSGIDEGARLVFGGPGKPRDMAVGHYVRPTIFSDVENNMTIAREEIFGPVLCIISYDDEAHALEIANDTDYGLAAYVSSRDRARAQEFAAQLRAGAVYLNGAGIDPMAPFGGYKHSGNGREWGACGFEEYLETKSVMGYGD